MRTMRRHVWCGIIVIAAMVMALTEVQAATYNWTQTGMGPYNWDNAGAQDNWGTGASGLFPNGVARHVVPWG